MLFLLACSTPKPAQAPQATEESFGEIWGETGLPWAQGISVVHQGELILPGELLSIETAPAGLAELHQIQLVLSNRSAENFVFPDTGWLSGAGFTLSSQPPAELSPEESTTLLLELNPELYSSAQTLSGLLEIPGTTDSYLLQADIPAPLRALVVGNGGYTLKSDDYGLTFEELSPKTHTHPLRAAAWGEGRFIRAWAEETEDDSVGFFEHSEDGLSWSAGSSDSLLAAWDCTYGLGRFLCIRGDTISWSEEGILWNHEETEHDYQLQKIIFIEDRFVAVGKGGRRVVSFDGLSWEVETFSGNPDPYFSLTQSEDLLVAVGGEDRYYASVSDDRGESWLNIPFGQCIGDSLRSIVYINNTFITEGMSSCHHNMHQSSDGFLWGPVIETEPFERYSILGMIQEKAIGYRAFPSGESKLYSSTDGKNWTELMSIPEGVLLKKMVVERWEQP
jgi:hypothetical protein